MDIFKSLINSRRTKCLARSNPFAGHFSKFTGHGRRVLRISRTLLLPTYPHTPVLMHVGLICITLHLSVSLSGFVRMSQNALKFFDQRDSFSINFVPLGKLMNLCDFCRLPIIFRPPATGPYQIFGTYGVHHWNGTELQSNLANPNSDYGF